MTFWLVAAVAGAPLVALGAALQQNAAVHCKSHSFLKLLPHLVRRPKWVLGSATTLCGAVMHVIALSNGPLTVVQPLGMSGLPIAVLIAAAIDRRRVRPAELLGTFAVSAGLVGLLLLLPHESSRPTLDGGSAAVLCGSALVLIAGIAVMARRSTGAVNALFLAIGSGVGYGVFAALTRVSGSTVLNAMSPAVFWTIALAVIFCLVGLLFQQNAYRTGRFALSYATMLVADPITGALIGVIVLNEQLPTSFLAGVGALAACALTVTGVVVLTRLHPPHHPTAEVPEPPAPATRELVSV